MDGDADTGWAILPQTRRENSAVIILGAQIDAAQAKPLTLTLSFQYGGRHSLGRFRVSASTIPSEMRTILALPIDQRTAQQQAQLAAHYRLSAPELANERAAIAELEAQQKTINDARVSTLVSTAGNPRTLRILPRGNWLDGP